MKKITHAAMAESFCFGELFARQTFDISGHCASGHPLAATIARVAFATRSLGFDVDHAIQPAMCGLPRTKLISSSNDFRIRHG